MGQKFYFFTDPTLLAQQTPEQAYGPQGTVNGKDVFRVTSQHPVTSSAPAIAVCDGEICFQVIDTNTFSIILKPAEQPALDLPQIKYFIYKGIAKTSLITSDELKTNSNIPFVDRIRNGWDSSSGTNPISNSAKVMGFDLTDPTKGFGIDDPIDHLFYSPNASFQNATVKAGETIGIFLSDAYFEIALERLGYDPEISMARSLETKIEVDAFTATGTVAADNYDQFLHWHKKEQCLSFLDPCAFFGSFSARRIYFQSLSGQTKCDTSQQVYDNLLKKFGNRNKVYLDIRNDYGLSLNYFKDYGFEIKLSQAGGTSDLDLLPISWPIFILEYSAVAQTGIKNGNYFYINLALPSGQNNVPLVYLSRAFIKRDKATKPKEKLFHPSRIVNGATGPYLAAFKLCFPLVEAAANDDQFCCGYYKVNLYDQDRNQPPGTGLAPKKEFYLDGLFRPLDMKQTITRAEGNLHYTIWHEEVLVNMAAFGRPNYIAHIGIARDQNNTTFFTIPQHFFSTSQVPAIPNGLVTFANAASPKSESIIQKIVGEFKHKNVSRKQLDVSSTLTELNLVVIENASFSVFRQGDDPDDYVFLIFENEELENVLQTFSGIGVVGIPKFMAQSLQETVTSTEGKRIKRTVLDGFAYAATTATLSKTPVPLSKELFEYADH